MDNANWCLNTNSNYEYLKFLEESGTDLGLESFANVHKAKKASRKSKKVSKKASRQSKKASRKSSRQSKKASRKSKKASRKASKKSKRASRKSKRSSRKASKKSKRASRKSKRASRKSKRATKKASRKKGKKYSHKFIKNKIAKNVTDLTPKISPSISPAFSQSYSSNYTLPQNNSAYITLPTLANPTTTTNPSSGVITVSQDNIGYRFDPRTNFGVSFNESSPNNYVYQGWQKLKDGSYTSRRLNTFTEVVLIILEVNLGIPTADGVVSSFNSKTGVYSYTSSLGGITEGLRYDPKSYFGVDFLESAKVTSYQAFTLDTNGNVQAVEIETVPSSVQIILGIVPGSTVTSGSTVTPTPAYAVTPTPAYAVTPTPGSTVTPTPAYAVTKRVPSGPILKLNPALSYRVTDSSSPRFPSLNQIILDSRDPILHTDGPEFVSMSPATGPTVGATINGPFVPFGTTVTAVQTIGTIPSDSSIPAQVITLSQPLVNVSEKPDDVFTYNFTYNSSVPLYSPTPVYTPAPEIVYSPASVYTPAPEPVPAPFIGGGNIPVGGLCTSNPLSWSNDIWIQCTGKPAPAPEPVPAPFIGGGNISGNVPKAGGPCMSNRLEWSNDTWIQCTGNPAPVVLQDSGPSSFSTPAMSTPVINQFVEDSKIIYRVTDNGYNTQGNFATHFPSSTKIILDSRKPTFDLNGKIINFGSTAFPPPIGSLISGPFVKPNTTVISVDDSGRLPSNPYVDGQTITISQPLENIVENRGQVFVYTFNRPDFSNRPMVGGPCITNPVNWDNDRWIQCTGKPKPIS